jgi:hypothetical protein
MRQYLPLVLAAMAVVTLGFVSVAHRSGPSELLQKRTSKLLVGSFNVNPMQNKKQGQPHGYGNQAAPQAPPNAHFYNTKDQKKEKLLVGSYTPKNSYQAQHGQAFGIGNQAAPQGHGVSDIGTNTVFHGVKADGGIAGAVKQHMSYWKKELLGKKALVGSFTTKGNKDHPVHPPHGYGNEAAPQGGLRSNHRFFNNKAKPTGLHMNMKQRNWLPWARSKTFNLKKEGVVGSYVPKTQQQQHHVPTVGFGNQAAPQGGNNVHFFNAKDQKKEKLLVGSFNVNPQNQQASQPFGIGNQAAPQGHMGDIGTNTVFHGVKADGGIAGVRKTKQHMMKKGLVGSFNVNPNKGDRPQPPHGYGNQAAPALPANAHFYNQ